MTSSRLSFAFALCLGLGACAHEAKQPQLSDRDAEQQQVADWVQRAHRLSDAADYTRAEQYLNLATKHGGDPAQVMPLLIDVCVRDQRYRAALQYAEEHLRRHPREYRLRYIEATLLRALGDIAKSRQELQRVLEASPDYADAHYSMAVLLRDQLGSYVEADQHFREYLRLAPRGQHAEEAGDSLLEAMP
ncbi:MAG TPA: tetratricopeptide repeat protein [Polyangiaceae bacterium]|nr:tetratricopeptide repeat protein [Polyangiaceae bacterium]